MDRERNVDGISEEFAADWFRMGALVETVIADGGVAPKRAHRKTRVNVLQEAMGNREPAGLIV